jgi:hypothetical protein
MFVGDRTNLANRTTFYSLGCNTVEKLGTGKGRGPRGSGRGRRRAWSESLGVLDTPSTRHLEGYLPRMSGGLVVLVSFDTQSKCYRAVSLTERLDYSMRLPFGDHRLSSAATLHQCKSPQDGVCDRRHLGGGWMECFSGLVRLQCDIPKD